MQNWRDSRHNWDYRAYLSFILFSSITYTKNFRWTCVNKVDGSEHIFLYSSVQNANKCIVIAFHLPNILTPLFPQKNILTLLTLLSASSALWRSFLGAECFTNRTFVCWEDWETSLFNWQWWWKSSTSS